MHRLVTLLEEIKQLLQLQGSNTKEFLTLGEAAIYLGMSKSTLYHKTSNREIDFFQPNGKMIFFKRASLDAYMARNPKPSIEAFVRREKKS